MTAVDSTAPLREYSTVEYTFEPHTKSRPPTREYLQSLWERRAFMVTLAKSELRGPNSNTLLGEVWSVLDPLIQAAIYLFLILIIRGGKGGANAGQTAILIVGCVFLFSITRSAISGGGQSILKSRGLVLNSTFPLAILPVAAMYTGLLEFLPSVGVYIVIHLLLQQPIGPGIALLPLLFSLQVIMGMGIAFLCATATVYVRDMVNVLNYLLRILIFVTPVIYPASALPAGLRPFLAINPLFALFSAYQTIILGGVPSAAQVLMTAFWAGFFIIVGYRVFVSRERAFALRL
jgi:ABC-type polysaccharide/polyol phosphate export permease